MIGLPSKATEFHIANRRLHFPIVHRVFPKEEANTRGLCFPTSKVELGSQISFTVESKSLFVSNDMFVTFSFSVSRVSLNPCISSTV